MADFGYVTVTSCLDEMRTHEEFMMGKSDSEVFSYSGNETNIIQADDSFQTKCYESENFQTFQKTASFKKYFKFFLKFFPFINSFPASYGLIDIYATKKAKLYC